MWTVFARSGGVGWFLIYLLMLAAFRGTPCLFGPIHRWLQRTTAFIIIRWRLRTFSLRIESVCIILWLWNTIPEGCVLFVPRNAPFYYYLATAHWQFCTLCTWSLTNLLRTRLKSPFSYINRTIIYVHAMHHRQNLNFSKLFRLEDGKKVSNTCQTVLRESSATQNLRYLTLFHVSCSTECWQSPFCLLKWQILL